MVLYIYTSSIQFEDSKNFKEIESFFGADPVDAYADEKDKTITGFIGMKYAPTVKYVYDFDGNKNIRGSRTS